MHRLLGDEYAAFEAALTAEPQTSIRLNPRQMRPTARLPTGAVVPPCLLSRHTAGSSRSTPGCTEACTMYRRPRRCFSTTFCVGTLTCPVRYLDLCAAPAEKAHSPSQPPGRQPSRVQRGGAQRGHILAENIAKWGFDNTVVTRNSAADFGALRHYFDVILVDAPCSGEGHVSVKMREAIDEWSPAQVDLCADRQREILIDVWDALRPGGLLIYSTCTYNREENEEMVHFLMKHFGATPLDAAPPEEWHIRPSLDTDLPAYRFMPHYTGAKAFSWLRYVNRAMKTTANATAGYGARPPPGEEKNGAALPPKTTTTPYDRGYSRPTSTFSTPSSRHRNRPACRLCRRPHPLCNTLRCHTPRHTGRHPQGSRMAAPPVTRTVDPSQQRGI